MGRSRQGANRTRGLFLTTLLAAALHLAHAPDALAAIAFVKNVGFLADNTTGTSVSITVPPGLTCSAARKPVSPGPQASSRTR